MSSGKCPICLPTQEMPGPREGVGRAGGCLSEQFHYQCIDGVFASTAFPRMILLGIGALHMEIICTVQCV